MQGARQDGRYDVEGHIVIRFVLYSIGLDSRCFRQVSGWALEVRRRWIRLAESTRHMGNTTGSMPRERQDWARLTWVGILRNVSFLKFCLAKGFAQPRGERQVDESPRAWCPWNLAARGNTVQQCAYTRLPDVHGVTPQLPGRSRPITKQPGHSLCSTWAELAEDQDQLVNGTSCNGLTDPEVGSSVDEIYRLTKHVIVIFFHGLFD